MSKNQAVVFTKPVHHLGVTLTPELLDERVISDFPACGFEIILRKERTGSELAAEDIIRTHYHMYSQASYGEFTLTDSGRHTFDDAFDRNWYEEVEAGRISGNPELMEEKGIDPHQLFDLWNERFVSGQTVKLQDGVIIAWVDEIDAFCINAFYPAMEANFYNSRTQIFYYVMEFDPDAVSWLDFRKKVLGATNAATADADSFRGRLYAEYPVAFPGRDNFVHGSAGPFEGLIERIIHEHDFDMNSNPVGRYLLGRGVARKQLEVWKKYQTLTALGDLFDATEEKDTEEVLQVLESVEFTTDS